jgi:putative spermidine/putrescine transport system permease protein
MGMINMKVINRNRSKPRYSIMDWLPLSPLILFALGFQLIPVISIIISSFNSKHGYTLNNYERAFTPMILNAFKNSIQLSTTTATLGVIIGAFVAYAIISSPNKFIQNALIALADVTTNFGGAPLAFAFIIILGSTGVITILLKELGINLYPKFRIYSISGLTIAYLYFQIPLMIMLILPSLLGLKKELWEAAINLGATTFQYWWYIALPTLAPALLSSFFILFVNSFGAYATAWTLTGPDVNLITVQIAALIRGEVQLEIELADALSVVSMCITLIGVIGYLSLARRSRRALS